MSAAQEMIDEASAEALRSLKKLLASRGSLLGHFYFAGDTRGSMAGILVTLTARDPKGSKVAARGKKLRQEISGAKFGRGLVKMKGTKLLFELHTGNATKDHMKLGFKKAFTAPENKRLKTMLRRALVVKVGRRDSSPEEVDESVEDEPTPELDLSAVLAPGELRALLAQQGDLEQRNADLKDSFLSASEAQAEIQTSTDELSREIRSLEQASTLDLRALQQKRYALAEMLYVGTDPFPEVGTPLPDGVRSVLNAAVTNLKLTDWSRTAAQWSTTAQQVTRQLDALKTALLADGDPELAAIAARDLPALAGPALTMLDDAIDALDGLPADKRAAGLARISMMAGTLADQLATDKAVEVIDNNPFGVSVSLQEVLIPELRALAAAARLS